MTRELLDRVWRCRYCHSTNVSVAVTWGGSVEPVDHGSDKLEPADANPQEAFIEEEFCNDCGAQEDGLLERVGLPVNA